jgi:hypothetical protein
MLRDLSFSSSTPRSWQIAYNDVLRTALARLLCESETTFNHVFLTPNGQRDRFPIPRSYAEIADQIRAILKNSHFLLSSGTSIRVLSILSLTSQTSPQGI